MTRPLCLANARLIDPASGYDGPGGLLIEDGVICEVSRGPIAAPGDDFQYIDLQGRILAPGLVDLCVRTGEPGAEPAETLKSAGLAAAAGGVTTVVLQPDTDPPVDDPAAIDFLKRRGAALGGVNIHAAGAATRGLDGQRMAEIGLMQEAGALYVTDGDRVLRDSRTLQRVMAYASAFNALVACRPKEPWLSEGATATGGEMASRLGLAGAPALAERMQLERDLALVELTGVRFLADRVSTASAMERIDQARARGLEVAASVSINHLSFNEIDIGDYRTFYRLDPPLRSEADRRAMVEALREGRADAVTSAHAPAPAEDKRRPFAEAAPGAVGLETLLPALLSLHHEDGIDLVDLLRPVTCGPAALLGLDCGVLAADAPADLVVFDPNAPVVIDADRLRSKSKNSPFDGRRLQGKVLMTLVGGRIVFEA